MSFCRYPDYKDSGINSIGHIPKHWSVNALRHSLAQIFSGINVDQVDESETTVPVTRIETISHGEINWNKVGHIEEIHKRSDRQLKVGDICFSNINSLEMIGNVARYKEQREIYAGINLLVLRASLNTSDKFLYWFLCSKIFRQAVRSLAKPAINQASISQGTLLSIPLCAPPISEQIDIAKFLDLETSKIDTLISKQEKLIQLLKEKRQAVMSNAVTKGIDSSVPMKESGEEWLEKIPAHWEVIKGRRLFEIKKRIAGKLGYQVLSITQKGIRFKDTESNEGQQSMDYSKYQLVDVGDFAMNHMDLLTGYVDISSTVGVTSPDYRVFSLSKEGERYPKYFLYLLQNCYLNKIFYPFGQGSSQLGRWRLPTEQFNNFAFPVPPLEDQIKIADFVSDQLVKIDTLSKQATKTIQILQERRSCLISLAVTGQIDVRKVATEMEAA